MSEFETFLAKVADFYSLTNVEKIKLFGWYLIDTGNSDRFSGSEVLRCFDLAGVKRPSNISQQLEGMRAKQPPDLLKESLHKFCVRGLID